MLFHLFFSVCGAIVRRYWWLLFIVGPVLIASFGLVAKLTGGAFSTAAAYTGIGFVAVAAIVIGYVAYTAMNRGFK